MLLFQQQSYAYKSMKKKQISPITGPRCPEGSRKLRFPDYVTLARNLALSTGRFLPPGNTPGAHFC